jgi:hypothetical protein
MYALSDPGTAIKNRMTARIFRSLALLGIALSLVACDGREELPDTNVRVINAASNFLALDFRRERTSGITLEFRDATPALRYDEDTYDFSVDSRGLLGTNNDVRTFEKKVLAGTEYTFVLMQVGTGVQEAILEYTPLAASATDSQAIALHAGENLPPMNVHIVAPGTDVTGLVPWATLGFRQSATPRRLAAGEYELVLTDAANTVLFRSQTVPLPATTTTVFVITPENGATPTTLSVVLQNDAVSIPLYDPNTQATLRVINGAYDKAPRDVIVAEQFSPPTYPAVPFAEPTAYAPAPIGPAIKLAATPPGNPGVLELDATIVTAFGFYTEFISGQAGALTQHLLLDDRRRIPGTATIRFYDGALQFTTGLDVFLTPTADLTNYLQAATVFPGLGSLEVRMPPADYQLTVTVLGTTTPVAGPIPVTLGDTGYYGVIIMDGATSSTADLVLIDEFP